MAAVLAKLSLAAAATGAGAAIVHGAGRGFLAGGMRPDEVARSFVSVENDWQAQASLFATCSNSTQQDSLVDCNAAPTAFAASCRTVVQAALQGSSGDRGAVREYLDDVCGQNVMNGWHKDRCRSLADAIHGSMTADSYTNRQNFDSIGLCSRFWTQFLAEETARAAQEQAQREERERENRKLAEEAEKKAAEEAEKRAAEEEVERKAAEEAKRKAAEEEAERKAVEEVAQAKAAEEAKAQAVVMAPQASNATGTNLDTVALEANATKVGDSNSVPVQESEAKAGSSYAPAPEVTNATKSTA